MRLLRLFVWWQVSGECCYLSHPITGTFRYLHVYLSQDKMIDLVSSSPRLFTGITSSSLLQPHVFVFFCFLSRPKDPKIIMSMRRCHCQSMFNRKRHRTHKNVLFDGSLTSAIPDNRRPTHIVCSVESTYHTRSTGCKSVAAFLCLHIRGHLKSSYIADKRKNFHMGGRGSGPDSLCDRQ